MEQLVLLAPKVPLVQMERLAPKAHKALKVLPGQMERLAPKALPE